MILPSHLFTQFCCHPPTPRIQLVKKTHSFCLFQDSLTHSLLAIATASAPVQDCIISILSFELLSETPIACHPPPEALSRDALGWNWPADSLEVPKEPSL